MWCVPELNAEYVERMEDVLDTLALPPNPKAPVVALDERPVQLLGSEREGRGVGPGKAPRQDYEYVRHGVANVFCIVAPHEGRHFTHATPRRKAVHFARAIKRIADGYPRADTIHLIVDNLNIHCEKSLLEAYGEKLGRRLWGRFTVHYTPKHGSWLNPAEIEVSLVSRQCLGSKRVPTFRELRARTTKWNARANRDKRPIRWRFKTRDARRVFGYTSPSTTCRSEH